MQQWHAALEPFTEHYLDRLIAAGFTNARAVYASLIAARRR
jgi:hypothetical protein